MLPLTIITTVYDRLDCLKNCIASVRSLTFKNYEHMIVSDHPPVEVSDAMRILIASFKDPRISYYDLPERQGAYGQAPGEYGLRNTTGKYVAFLSDDNGYLPGRFEPLIEIMEADVALSFVYTACYYAYFGGVLRVAAPQACRIDMGQPLFRRTCFLRCNNSLPFYGRDGDWHLIRTFMDFGTWKFVDDPTFVFRLKDFPQFIVRD